MSRKAVKLNSLDSLDKTKLFSKAELYQSQ